MESLRLSLNHWNLVSAASSEPRHFTLHTEADDSVYVVENARLPKLVSMTRDGTHCMEGARALVEQWRSYEDGRVEGNVMIVVQGGSTYRLVFDRSII